MYEDNINEKVDDKLVKKRMWFQLDMIIGRRVIL